MNVRAEASEACRGGGKRCILDPPSPILWARLGTATTDVRNNLTAAGISASAATTTAVIYFNGRIGAYVGGFYSHEVSTLAYHIFMSANATFAAAAERYRASSGEHCAFGHTDVAHASQSTVGECRPLTVGDTCSPIPTPFVCMCVSESVAFTAKDTLGDHARFNFMMLGFVCCGIATFDLVLSALGYVRYLVRRRRASRGGMRREKQRDAADYSPVDSAGKETKEEFADLWGCAKVVTLVIAALGGPGLILWTYRWPLG